MLKSCANLVTTHQDEVPCIVYHPFYVWGKTHWEWRVQEQEQGLQILHSYCMFCHVKIGCPHFIVTIAICGVFELLDVESQGLKKHGHWEMFRIVTMQLNFLIDHEWSGIRPILFLSNFDSKLSSSDVLWEEKFAIISQYAIVWLFFWLWNMAGYLASGFPYSCFFRLDGFQRVMVWWHDAMMVNLASYTQPWAFQQEGCQPDTSLGQQMQRYFWTAHHWEKQGRHMDVLFGWVLSQYPTVDAPGLFP